MGGKHLCATTELPFSFCPFLPPVGRGLVEVVFG